MEKFGAAAAKDPVAESTVIEATEKYFLLKSGEKMEIPEDVINEFACLEGLKANKERSIPLHDYPHGAIRKHHLELLFEFYKQSKLEEICKETPPNKMLQWSPKFFSRGGFDDLLPEMLLIGSYLVATTFVECALWYYSSKMEAMSIPQMRQCLGEESDFADGEFAQLAKEETWRDELVKWGIIADEREEPDERSPEDAATEAAQKDTKALAKIIEEGYDVGKSQ